jgi:hypothetical protein|tara:strand:+ start:492 stop:605 length:114 start_codon:yes stop_codon:yes gene_type:complete
MMLIDGESWIVLSIGRGDVVKICVDCRMLLPGVVEAA